MPDLIPIPTALPSDGAVNAPSVVPSPEPTTPDVQMRASTSGLAPRTSAALIAVPESISDIKGIQVQSPEGQMQAFPSGRGISPNLVPPSGITAYAQRNKSGDIPLDPTEEIGPWVALMADFRKNKEDQIRYLGSVFGAQNVRADERGEPIIRVTDPKTGKQKDVLLNAYGMTVNDLMELASTAPQMAGSLLGFKGVEKIAPAFKGTKAFAAKAVGAAVGGEAAVAAEDVAARAYDRAPLELSKEIRERALQVPVDTIYDYAMAGAAAPLRFIRRAAMDLSHGQLPAIASPLWRFRGPIQNNAIKSREFIAAKTGIEIPMTAAETTGIPFLAKMYEYVYRHPAGASPILRQQEAKDAAKKAFQEYMVEPMTLADDETVGRQIVSLLDQISQGAERQVSQTAKATEARIRSQVMGDVAAIPSVPSEVSMGEAGRGIREKIIAGRDAAKAEQNALREQIAKLPGGTGKVFESGEIGLQARAEKQLKSLPSPEQTITEETGLLDQYGQPMMVTKTGRVLEKQFVPPHVVERLQSLTKEKKYSLSDLIQMRTDVYEDIAAGQAVPNTGTHYLNEIGKMLTGAIEEGVEKLPPGNLKTLLKKANEQYKTKVIPFESSGIAPLFKEISEGGYVENSAVVRRLMGDPDKYQRTLDFIGRNSPEHERLKRSIFDQVMRDSSDDLEGKVLNVQGLADNLKRMAKDPKQRAIFQDIFGDKARPILDSAELLSKIPSLQKGTISREDLELILARKSPKDTALYDLAKAHAERALTYKNDLIRKFASGPLDPAKINPEDFVRLFVDAGSFTDVASVWGAMASNPNLQDQVRRKLLYEVFSAAQRSPEPADIAAKLAGDTAHVVTSAGLNRALGDASRQQKLNLILGKDRMDLLKATTSLQAAEDWAKIEAGSTGIFASGNAVGGLLRGGFSKAWEIVPEILKYKLVAIALSSTQLTKLLESTYTPKEIPSLIRAIVTSEPFVRAITEDASSHVQAYQDLNAFKKFAGLVVPTPDFTHDPFHAQPKGTQGSAQPQP